MSKLLHSPGTEEIEAQKVALRGEFPAWSIIHTTDTGRWWATRGPLVREDLNEEASVDADTPDGLRRKIREHAGGKAAGR